MKGPQFSKVQLGSFALISALGIIAGYLQVKPEPDNSFFTLYVTHFDPVRLKWAFSRFIHAYLAIPNFTNFHFWNTNFFVPEEKNFGIGITPMLFMAWIAGLHAKQDSSDFIYPGDFNPFTFLLLYRVYLESLFRPFIHFINC